MAALKVEILEKENVRPFSPTPESLTNYKLTLTDQLCGCHYIPTFFLYNSGAGADYDKLKQSLSKTLSVLYPLAGRVKDGITIECNDKGAAFVRANVTNYDLSDFLELQVFNRKLHLLEHLLPYYPFPMDFDTSRPLLGVQVNKFRCGGTALAICFWHGVGDAAAIAGFVRTWAAINGGSGGGGNLVVDATTIFPPQLNFDFYSSTPSYATKLKMDRLKVSIKRFVFRKQEIERMRDKFTLSDRRRPSRAEALSAFLWAAVIRATQQAQPNQNAKTMHVLTHVLDLRTRLNPPFPSMCLGNIIQPTIARWITENAAAPAAQSLVDKVREALVKVTGEYLNKMQAQDGLLKLIATQVGKIKEDKSTSSANNAIKVFTISSLLSLPFHELDFGWGKPIWFAASPFTLNDSANFYRIYDGGIEVLIGLAPQVMSRLDKDKEFLAHVSSSQTMSEPPTLPTRL